MSEPLAQQFDEQVAVAQGPGPPAGGSTMAPGGRTMARISRLLPDQVDPEIGALFRKFLEERGNIPNMFRTVAPDVGMAIFSIAPDFLVNATIVPVRSSS